MVINLTGVIPKSLRNCTSLQRVRLDGNHLTGNISQVFGVYPDLYYINLSNNKFYGEVSPNWGRSSRLTDLELAGNHITGSIPPEIGNATRLQVLDLSSNYLVGEIPKEFGRLTSLVKLILTNNQFSGGIPLEIGSLTNLEYLDLSTNKLSNLVPGCIGNFSKLYHMNLSHNEFSRGIPTQIAYLVQLCELDLSHNNLTGEIPTEFGNLKSLVTMNISHNNFSGILPRAFDDMLGLLYVNIAFNELWGPIPNNKAFHDAPIEALEGNKGLCGQVKGLQPCQPSTPDKHFPQKIVFIIIFPILGVLVLLFALAGMLMKQRSSPKIQDENLYPVLTLDGKILYEEIIAATGDFDATYCIGRGGHGSVYKAQLPSGNIVAAKKIHTLCDGDYVGDRKEFLNEIKALREIRHRNIVKLHGFCSNARHSFLIYEYLEKGSLAEALSKEAEAKELNWSRRVNVVKDVAHALSYMHHDCSPPIVHRDISSKNILLDSDYVAHVSDFGTAKLLKPDSSNLTFFAGTFGYLAPGN
jgi:uncharacterized protein YjbI with pentapeptide repeats